MLLYLKLMLYKMKIYLIFFFLIVFYVMVNFRVFLINFRDCIIILLIYKNWLRLLWHKAQLKKRRLDIFLFYIILILGVVIFF